MGYRPVKKITCFLILFKTWGVPKHQQFPKPWGVGPGQTGGGHVRVPLHSCSYHPKRGHNNHAVLGVKGGATTLRKTRIGKQKACCLHTKTHDSDLVTMDSDFTCVIPVWLSIGCPHVSPYPWSCNCPRST